MKAYLTMEYKHEYATVNSLWAAARQQGYAPDRIHLLTPDPQGELAKRLTSMLGAVQASLGKAPNVTLEAFDPEELAATRRLVRQFIKARKMEGDTVAVDVTPGRTQPKLAVFKACMEQRPDHLFYLSVPDYDYRPLPLVRIPFRLQRSLDLLEEVTKDV